MSTAQSLPRARGCGRPALVALALATLTLTVFLPVGGHQFVNYDDPLYVSENPQVRAGLTPAGVHWAFTSGSASNWHPLTWLSHMLDVEVFGMEPGRHHLVSLAFHLLNTLGLFLVLRALTGALWQSAAVAALFGIHPQHVESVAWVAERKDVLSTFFWILTMAAYGRYVRRPGARRYLFVSAAFILGLLAKPMLVTLPFALLLLDFWPLGRLRSASGSEPAPPERMRFPGLALPLLLEKAPLFALAAFSSTVTYLVQRQGGAVKNEALFPFAARSANAVVAAATYVGKALWPSGLAVYYPHPIGAPTWWVVAAAAGVLLACTALSLAALRRRPFLAVGWFWYLGTLVPVAGLVQIGTQARADRYSYVPLIGLFLGAAWSGIELLEKRLPGRAVTMAAIVAGLAALSVAARIQVETWRDSETLYRQALRVTQRNFIAHNNLGSLLLERGELAEAIENFRQALLAEPLHPDVHYNLGNALARIGQYREAAEHYRETLRIHPDYPEAHGNLAWVLAELGDPDAAILHYRESLRLRPGDAVIHFYLGSALLQQQRFGEAAASFRSALRLKPDYPLAREKLGQIEALPP